MQMMAKFPEIQQQKLLIFTSYFQFLTKKKSWRLTHDLLGNVHLSRSFHFLSFFVDKCGENEANKKKANKGEKKKTENEDEEGNFWRKKIWRSKEKKKKEL